MRISGFISLALLASFASALPPKKSSAAAHHTTPTKTSSHKSTPTISHSSPTAKVSSKSAKVTSTNSPSAHQTSSTNSPASKPSSGTSTGSATGTPTNKFLPIACSDVTGSGVSRRAFPRVQGLTRTCDQKKMIDNDDELLKTMAANGAKYLDELASTEKNRPAPPSDIKDFLSKYSITMTAQGKALGEAVCNTNPQIAAKTNSATSSKFNEVRVKTSEKKEPYQAYISEDGSVCINTFSYTSEDVGEKNQGIMFEDIVTYMLAFNADQDKFKAGDASIIPDAVKKIKFMYRQNVEGKVANAVINAVYSKNGWAGAVKRMKMQTPKIDSDDAKALLATDNGTLGPKLLGTNMKTLHSGKVSNADIAYSSASVLLELTHG